MEFANINPKEIIFSLDIGTRSVIGTVGLVKDKKFHVLYEFYTEHEDRAMIDGQIHDITLVAKAVNDVKTNLEQKLNFSLSSVAIAAAGRFLRTTTVKSELKVESERDIDKDIIRGLELTAVKQAENEVNSYSEGRLYCVGYSVKNYFLNGYIITNLISHKGEKIGVEVIATFLPRSVVDSLYAVMKRVGLEVISLTLEPIAAIEAAIPQNLRLLNLALVDIGAGTSDIAISSKDSIAAYGMVPVAGDEVTEAIAHAYLVDFNTAERMKRECGLKELIAYRDILGLENEVCSEDLIKVMLPVVEKICDEISSKINELNGGKAPNAVFLVGGGAHTPKLKEILADKLRLPVQRIGIKGREAVTDCVCRDNSLGSIGVTVLGIALVSIKRRGNDFINVFLNGSVVTLFNSHKHTVMDALLQAGVNPKVLMGKNGKNIRFTVNGAKRLAFGALATSASIKINGVSSGIDGQIHEGDRIEVIYAQDGKDASPKLADYVEKIYSLNFYVNDDVQSMEPICFINGERSNLQAIIGAGDSVVIEYPSTLGDYIKLYLKEENGYKCFLKDKEIQSDYTINEGDKIYIIDSKAIQGEHKESTLINNCGETEVSEGLKVKAERVIINTELKVIVNDNTVILRGKERYIFIDVFDFIDFDLTKPRGNLSLKLNGNKAGYYDELKDKDIIKVYWE